ncbi:MAG: 4Fe-4S binding protein [Candidatus Tectomicrobia bacterium]|nr:4Fe-4S binding protein [Candidatus Tectomicrobia bacterium]
MPWVITRLCRDCLDMACVEVCPVDCIYEYTGGDDALPNQLFIDPEECIDCGVCEPECPWEAIFEEEAVPKVFKEDIELNKQIVGAERTVPEKPDKPRPTAEEVKANKEKWGYVD